MELKDYSKSERAKDARSGIIRAFSGNHYKVTGHTTDGRRFSIHTSNPYHALGINLFKGSKWVKYADETSWRRFMEA